MFFRLDDGRRKITFVAYVEGQPEPHKWSFEFDPSPEYLRKYIVDYAVSSVRNINGPPILIWAENEEGTHIVEWRAPGITTVEEPSRFNRAEVV